MSALPKFVHDFDGIPFSEVQSQTGPMHDKWVPIPDYALHNEAERIRQLAHKEAEHAYKDILDALNDNRDGPSRLIGNLVRLNECDGTWAIKVLLFNVKEYEVHITGGGASHRYQPLLIPRVGPIHWSFSIQKAHYTHLKAEAKEQGEQVTLSDDTTASSWVKQHAKLLRELVTCPAIDAAFKQAGRDVKQAMDVTQLWRKLWMLGLQLPVPRVLRPNSIELGIRVPTRCHRARVYIRKKSGPTSRACGSCWYLSLTSFATDDDFKGEESTHLHCRPCCDDHVQHWLNTYAVTLTKLTGAETQQEVLQSIHDAPINMQAVQHGDIPKKKFCHSCRRQVDEQSAASVACSGFLCHDCANLVAVRM